MSGIAGLVAAHLLMIAFGTFIAWQREAGRMPLPSRLGLAYAVGSVVLVVHAVILTLFGVRWTIPRLAVPPIVLSASLSILLLRKRDAPEPPSRKPRVFWWLVSVGIGVLAFAHALLSFGTSRGISIDFIYFWGVKGIRFATHGGIDATLLRWEFFGHAVPDYPPLVPIVQAWGAMLAGEMLWTIVPAFSAVWILAAALVVHGYVENSGVRASLPAAVFWMAALSVSVVHSYSGGNAEAMLICFSTVAIASVMAEREGEQGSRLIAALALAGAVLTKVEAVVGWVALLAGVLGRDALLGRKQPIRASVPLLVVPAGALALWFFFQWENGLPVGYASHGALWRLHWEHLGTILGAFPRHLSAGAWGLPWILPFIALAAQRRRLREAIPAFAVVAALFSFFVFDYLHDAASPVERIGWTLPRISQPALSAWILAAVFTGRNGAGGRDRLTVANRDR